MREKIPLDSFVMKGLVQVVEQQFYDLFNNSNVLETGLFVHQNNINDYNSRNNRLSNYIFSQKMPFNKITLDFVKLFENQPDSVQPFYFHTFINHPSVHVRYIFFKQNSPFSQQKLYSLKKCQQNCFLVQCIQIETNPMIQIQSQNRLQTLSIEYQKLQRQDDTKLFNLVNPQKKQLVLIYTQDNQINLEEISSNLTLYSYSYYYIFYFKNQNIRIYLQSNKPFFFGFKLNNQLYSIKELDLNHIQFINNSIKFIPKDWQLFNKSLNYLLINRKKDFQNLFYIGYKNQTIIYKSQIMYLLRNDKCIQNCNQDSNQYYNSFQRINIPAIISISICSFFIVLIFFFLLVYYCKKKKQKINQVETNVKIVKIKKQVQQINTGKNLECIICLEKFNQLTIKLFPCKHNMFHSNCIKQWVQKKKQCPLCRSFIQQLQQF